MYRRCFILMGAQSAESDWEALSKYRRAIHGCLLLALNATYA